MKKYFWYSIYLNSLSLLICILCIIFALLINRFVFVSILLFLIVLLELILNILSYKKYI